MLRIGLSSSARPTIVNISRQAPFAVRQLSTLRPPNVTLQALKQRANGFATKGPIRTYMSEPNIIKQGGNAFAWKRTAFIAGGLACAVVLTDGFLNRETKEGGFSVAERALLHDTFKYTGGGLVLTALAARALFQSGFAYKVLATNPWLVLGAGVVGGVGSMMGTMYTSPDKPIQKHLFWLAFNACQAATLSPMYFFAPAILSRAALYTCLSVGALSYVGATAKSDQYLYLGGPLLAGLFVVGGAALAPMILPMGMRSLAVTEAISLYGGLAVFGGFVLYDTQKILAHARMSERGLMRADPLSESISLELDMINIFIRLVQVMAFNNKKK